MKIELTVGAFRAAYSGTSLFLVGEDILPALDAVLGSKIDFLVLGADGCVYQQGEQAGGLDTRLAPVGMAIGVRGILAGKRTLDAAKAWESYAASQKMFDPLPVKLLSGMKGRMRLAAARFMLTCKTKEAKNLQEQMADKEAGMSYLRRKNEGLLLNLEKARRMIRGAGFGLQSITAELPAGDETIGPGGTIDTVHFTQLLPADAMGLWAVSLYARSGEADQQDPNGHIEVRVLRVSDGTCLAQDTKPFTVLDGWLQFDLSDACSTIMGDALLEVSWHGLAAGAPLLALASVDADRFGDATGRTLALRLIKGLADPSELKRDAVGHGLSPLLRDKVSPDELQRRAQWAFEGLLPEAPEGTSLLSIGMEDDWLQTHPHASGPSGVRYAGVLSAGASEISIKARTDHQHGPHCLYSVLAVEHLEGEDATVRSRKVLDYLANAQGGPVAGLHAVQRRLAPEHSTALTLRLDTPLERRADLFLVVEVPDGIVSYGWCRWFDLEIGNCLSAIGAGLVPITPTSPTALRLQSLKFPQLAGRIEFASGAKKLDELSKSLGFSPLLVSEETGSLQTHPLQDEISAAVLAGGVPTTTLRVASEVETAHYAAPAFLYVLAIVSPAVKERERAIRNVLSRIDPQDPKSWHGINARKTVQWEAKMLYARQSATIEMELALALEAPGDVVFAVKPAGQSVSYGWCRWYSLSITSAPEAHMVAGPKSDD